jgi:hypothetical protein
MTRYRDLDFEAPEYEPMMGWSSDAETEDLAAWLANIGGGAGDGAPAGDGEAAWLQPTPAAPEAQSISEDEAG